MPNRLIREAMNDSDAVNRLSLRGEVFYRRLQLLVDDYGRCENRPAQLLSKLFWLQLDRWSLNDVTSALQECANIHRENGDPLIRLYRAENRNWLEITEFKQRLRAKYSRCPTPSADPAPEANSEPAYTMTAICQSYVCHTSAESESETETESETLERVEGIRQPPPTPPKEEPAAASTHALALGKAETLLSVISPSHSEHGVTGNMARARDELMLILETAANPEATWRLLVANHAAWVPYWRAQISANPHKAFVPHLWRWFRDGDCWNPPGESALAVARAGPKKAPESALELMLATRAIRERGRANGRH